MADSSITWDLIARDRASQTVGRVGDSVESLTKRVGHLAAAFGGAFALQQAGAFALKMADQFELSRSRLQTITKNIGSDFSSVSGQVQALDDRLAAFGFTNADVEGAVASLETATKNVPKALKDVALAADIARGRNISLEESTRILQRVETGHVSMLSRLGIATKDASGHLLTQKQALEELAKTYGGNASHYAETFAGKQAALRAELGNSAAEIGTALLPAAVDLAHVIQTDVLPAIEASAHFFERNRKEIEPLVGLVIKLALAYKALKVLRGVTTGLAAEAGASTLGAGASLARPVPVFVTNWKGGGTSVFGKTAAEGGTAAAEEASLRSRIGAALPKLGQNVLRGFIIATVADALGSAIGGGPGGFIKTVGKGAGFGAILGPEGAVAGAGITAAGIGVDKGITALSNSLAPSDAESNVIKQLMANGQGAANLAKLHQIAANQMKNSGQVGREVTLEINGLTAALNRQKGAVTGAAGATKGDTAALDANSGAVTRNASQLLKYQARVLAVSQGQDDLRQAIHNMAVVVGGQSSRALTGNSDAALANRDALRGAVAQAQTYLGVLKQHGATADHVARVELNLAKAIKQNADNTYGNSAAVQDLLKQLGFLPGEIQQVINALGAAQGAWDATFGSTRFGLSDFKAGPKQKKAGEKAGQSFASGYSPVIDKASTAAADKAKQAFEAAASKMRADLTTILGDFRNERDSLLSSFSAIQTTGTDILGASGPGQSIKAQLKVDAAQMHTFARLWHRLADLGLDPRLLAQFAGPDYIPAMRELLRSGKSGIRQVDRLERSIARDAAGIARTDALTKDGQILHHDLETLPPKLRKELISGLQNAKFNVVFDTGKHDRHNGRKVRHHG